MVGDCPAYQASFHRDADISTQIRVNFPALAMLGNPLKFFFGGEGGCSFAEMQKYSRNYCELSMQRCIWAVRHYSTHRLVVNVYFEVIPFEGWVAGGFISSRAPV